MSKNELLTERQYLKQLDKRIGDLVARGSAKRDLSEFAKYWDNPVGFMREELRFNPWAKQIEVVESFMANKRTAVRGAHSMGKDAILAPLMLFAAYVRGMLVIAISATEKQLLAQLWREVGERFTARLPGELYSSDLRINGRKRILTMTSGSTSNLTGYHDPAGVFIAITEGQGEQVEAAAFDAAASNATDDLSKIMVVGNPVTPKGRFYEVHQKSTWNCIRISAFDHPNIIENRMAIPGGPSPSWPGEMAAEYGTSSAFYMARVLAEFPHESLEGLVRRDWIRAAFDRHENGELEARWGNRPLTMALDVARLGPDKTVLAILQGGIVREFVAWQGQRLTDTAARVIREGSERAKYSILPPVAVDEPGIGGGVIDILQEKRYPHSAFNGGRSASDDQRFLNLRSESHWGFRMLLERGEIALPRDPLLEEEALGVEWQLNSKGQIQIVGKEALRSSLGRSPDHLDSVVIGFHEARIAPMRRPIISTELWELY